MTVPTANEVEKAQKQAGDPDWIHEAWHAWLTNGRLYRTTLWQSIRSPIGLCATWVAGHGPVMNPLHFFARSLGLLVLMDEAFNYVMDAKSQLSLALRVATKIAPYAWVVVFGLVSHYFLARSGSPRALRSTVAGLLLSMGGIGFVFDLAWYALVLAVSIVSPAIGDRVRLVTAGQPFSYDLSWDSIAVQSISALSVVSQFVASLLGLLGIHPIGLRRVFRAATFASATVLAGAVLSATVYSACVSERATVETTNVTRPQHEDADN